MCIAMIRAKAYGMLIHARSLARAVPAMIRAKAYALGMLMACSGGSCGLFRGAVALRTRKGSHRLAHAHVCSRSSIGFREGR